MGLFLGTGQDSTQLSLWNGPHLQPAVLVGILPIWALHWGCWTAAGPVPERTCHHLLSSTTLTPAMPPSMLTGANASDVWLQVVQTVRRFWSSTDPSGPTSPQGWSSSTGYPLHLCWVLNGSAPSHLLAPGPPELRQTWGSSAVRAPEDTDLVPGSLCTPSPKVGFRSAMLAAALDLHGCVCTSSHFFTLAPFILCSTRFSCDPSEMLYKQVETLGFKAGCHTNQSHLCPSGFPTYFGRNRFICIFE